MGQQLIYQNTADPSVVRIDYHGCKLCYHYSCLFGRAHDTITISNDEDFEVWKAKFVEHFNKKHRNLMINKPKEVKTYKKVEEKEQPDQTRLIEARAAIMDECNTSPQYISVSAIREAMRNSDTLSYDRICEFCDGVGVTGAQIPEYETTGEEVTRRMRD